MKNMLRILPFFEVRSINIRRHLSKRQPACIFFPFRFVPPYGGGMEINMKNMLRTLPFFRVRSIDKHRPISKSQQAFIFFMLRFEPPHSGGMED